MARIGIGGAPYDLLFHRGSVWVANASAGSVVRIDPRTNRVVKRIVTGGTPANITVGLGAVWVGSASGTQVFRIDPATNALTSDRGGRRDADDGRADRGRALGLESGERDGHATRPGVA